VTTRYAGPAALGLLIGALVITGAVLALRPSDRGAGERAFATAYPHIADAWAQREAALQARVAPASDRGPERLLALFRDARADTERTRRDIAGLNPPEASRADLGRFDHLLATRAVALDRVITALTTSRADGLPAAVGDLARTSAQLQSVHRRIDQRLGARPTS
jgi:hypothetical protein